MRNTRALSPIQAPFENLDKSGHALQWERIRFYVEGRSSNHNHDERTSDWKESEWDEKTNAGDLSFVRSLSSASKIAAYRKHLVGTHADEHALFFSGVPEFHSPSFSRNEMPVNKNYRLYCFL